jgi:hypothetical protein
VTALKTKAEVFGKNQSGHDRGTRAMSWPLTLLVSVICSFSFAATAEAASVRDVLDPAFQYQPGASLSIDAGDQNVANPQLDSNANEVWAVMFSVNMP